MSTADGQWRGDGEPERVAGETWLAAVNLPGHKKKKRKKGCH